MQCPFLKKINFKKVSQIVSDDATLDQMKENTADLIIPTDQDFDFPDETIENINSSDMNKHNVYYFNSRINIPQSSNSHLQIKYPKQLQIKKMINYNELMQIEEEQQNGSQSLISESEVSQMKNVPHVLISKMSMLTDKYQHIFHGQILLLQENQNIYQCQIKEKCIKIYQEDKIKYYIELKKAKCRLNQIKQNKAVLSAICKNNLLELKVIFKSEKKLMAFLKALQLNNLDIEQQKQIQNLVISEKLNYSYSMDSLGFEVQRMDISQLKKVGQTFDILLFKNRNIMSKMQRLLTNSDYDHVAMLLKTSNNQMYILESSSNAGVTVYTLDSLINLPRKKYYFRVGLRQYRGQRKYKEILQLQDFIRDTVGKKYKFDPMYLISSQVKKGDTYFCSQLISQALQRVGIMTTSRPSYKYLPKHFGEEQLNQSIKSGQYSEVIILQ